MELVPGPFSEPPKRERKWKNYAVFGFIGTAALGAWIALDWEHPLGSDISPDGTLRADYSYSIRGIPELILEPLVNPRLHLAITDARTGKVISRHEYLGDIATIEEARDRFKEKIPWTMPDDSK